MSNEFASVPREFLEKALRRAAKGEKVVFGTESEPLLLTTAHSDVYSFGVEGGVIAVFKEPAKAESKPTVSKFFPGSQLRDDGVHSLGHVCTVKNWTDDYKGRFDFEKRYPDIFDFAHEGNGKYLETATRDLSYKFGKDADYHLPRVKLAWLTWKARGTLERSLRADQVTVSRQVLECLTGAAEDLDVHGGTDLVEAAAKARAALDRKS